MDEVAAPPAPPIKVYVVEDQTKILKNQLKLLRPHFTGLVFGNARLQRQQMLFPDLLGL